MSFGADENIFSDSEDELSDFNPSCGREAIIFLVDAYLYKQIQLFQQSLDVIKNSIVNGLLTNAKDLVGVVFFNTKNSPEPKDKASMENIVVLANNAILLPLKQVSKDIVSYFLNFSTPDYFDFGNKYGTTDGSFSNAIWLCTNMFKQCGFSLGRSTIVLFTIRENPSPENSFEFQKAVKKAGDLKETNVGFTLIPMIDEFAYEPFYKEFICTARDIELEEFIVPNRIEDMQFIENRQVRLDRNRCQVHLKWTLGENLKLAVGLYQYYRRNVHPKTVKLLREDNSFVDAKRSRMIADFDIASGVSKERYCKPGDERMQVSVGGEKIKFSTDELAKLRSPLVPGLILLGFKPQSIIFSINLSKSCVFLYPDEKTMPGSTCLFRALWLKCIEKRRLALCVIVTKRKTAPRYVALIPSHTNNSVVSPIQNDVFQVMYLPFEIDYRAFNSTGWEVPEVRNAEVDLFAKLVKKSKWKFSPSLFSDTYLKELLKNIAALSLDIRLEMDKQNVFPDLDEQRERVQSLIDQIGEVFGKDPESSSIKRLATTAAGGQQKIPKISTDLPSKSQIATLIESNKLSALTVKQLRSYLLENNVKIAATAKKNSLMEKVTELHLI